MDGNMEQYEADVQDKFGHTNSMDSQPGICQTSSCDNNNMDKQQEQDSGCGENDMNRRREIQQDGACSCEDSDIDRQNMLSNYASETYLQRWSQDTGDREKVHKTAELVNQEHSDSKLNITMNSLREECPQLDTAVDYDGMSLVSYNSVALQDGRPPPVTRNCTESRHYPYRFDVREETATAWKGYGGNIYFDPLNCQPLRILTSKTVKTHTQKISGKGHSLQQERKYKLQHKSCLPVLIGGNMFVSHTGETELGSLRMDRAKSWQRNCSTESMSKPSQRGKICKGFSERIVLQTLRKVKEPRRCVSAPEPLVVSGLSNQAVDSSFDPIYGVTKCNTKIRAAEFGLHGRNTFPIVCSAGKLMQCSNGTFLETLSLPTLTDDLNKNTSTGRNQNSPEMAASVQEPKPVFIIPFGAFDDPVADQESVVSVSLKKKQKTEKLKKPKHVKSIDKKKSEMISEHEVNEKENVKMKIYMPGSTKSTKKSTEIEKQKLVSKSAPARQCYQEFSTQQDSELCQNISSDYTENMPTIYSTLSEVSGQNRNTTVGKQYNKEFQRVHSLHKQTKTKQSLVVPQVTSALPETDTQFKREISNASLSNYLSAVSSQPPQIVETQKVTVPRLSYTKRARPFYVQAASSSDSSQYFSEYDQSEMNNGQVLCQSPALRGGYNSGYDCDQRRVNKQFRVMLSTSDKTPDSSCSPSRSRDLVQSTSPRKGVLKRTCSLTKSTPRLGVKFSLDSPGGRLGINGTEYQLPTISRQSGAS